MNISPRSMPNMFETGPVEGITQSRAARTTLITKSIEMRISASFFLVSVTVLIAMSETSEEVGSLWANQGLGDRYIGLQWY